MCHVFPRGRSPEIYHQKLQGPVPDDRLGEFSLTMGSSATSAPQSAERVLSGERSLIEGQILTGILYQLLEGLRSLLILIYRSSRINLTFSHSKSLANRIYRLLVQSTRTYTKHVHGRTHYGWQGLTPRLCAEKRG